MNAYKELSAHNYRKLSDAEIIRLEQQGCTAEDWSMQEVHPDIDLQWISQVHFSGENRIGQFTQTFTLPGGIRQHAGIRQATLHETTVGNDCLINNITGHIAHYDIEENCIILQAGNILTDGETTFGQGTEISVLSETGGREIILHDRLSAQEAYMQAMYRHNPALTTRLHQMAQDRAESVKNNRGRIGQGSLIIRCGILKNVNIGTYCHIEGATHLEDGTICSHKDSSTHIGNLVIARQFIIQTGCHISDGAMLTRCYVGQASIIGHGYSASDSYFACNCQAENGEACAIFAGPYTVTHHKSTLLIGGMFSFMNAGSGTNQSNHMYKLGPSHHGVLERGCKTASGSHILWPARVGAFSLIMGHCNAHADTSLFPFSYLLEQNNANYLLPGIALRNVGTLRDITKWPARDGRSTLIEQQDKIHFEAYSPYTINKMLKALTLMEEWSSSWNEQEKETIWNGLHIKRKAIDKGKTLYQQAIDRYIGEQFMIWLEEQEDIKPSSLHDLPQTSKEQEEQWCDLCGLLVRKEDITALEERISQGEIQFVEELDRQLTNLYYIYKVRAREYTWQLIRKTYPQSAVSGFSKEICLSIIRRWEEAVTFLNTQIIHDALKEFAPETQVGFGIDGNKEETQADFRAVRGCPDKNKLILSLQQEQEAAHQKAGYWMERLFS